LKKQKAKKAGGAKKKDKKEETEPTEEAPVDAEAEAEAPTPAPADDKAEDAAPESTESAEPAEPASPEPVDDDEPTDLPVSKPSHGRKPSVAVESRQRSESFYRSGAGPTSPTGLTPGGGVSSEIYREQVQKIAELEAEKTRLAAEAEEYKTKWEKNEEELEEFREGKGEAAIALEKSKEADKLVCGVIRLQLQYKTDPWCRSRRSSLSRASYRSSGHRPRSRLEKLQPLHPAKQSQSMT
jgi:nucleotide-binding universal stress UspA family protein